MRRLLVNAAHYILGPFGPDCDLRRFGQKVSSRGAKLGKKKAIVAVARKLAVLLITSGVQERSTSLSIKDEPGPRPPSLKPIS